MNRSLEDAANIAAGNSKTFNIIKVVDVLRHQGEATVSDIAQNTTIPVATLYRLIHILLQEELVLKTEKAVSANGRQPVLHSINPEYASALCITLEKTTIQVCLTSLSGGVLQLVKLDFKSQWEKEELLEEIDKAIFALTDAQWGKGSFERKVRVIYVAVEADVDIAAGKILRFSGARCLDDFDVVSYFQTRYGTPAHLNKLLYVEAVASIGSYCRYNFIHYVYLHIGVGFGATIVIDNKIYVGANNKAGELVRLKTEDGRSWEEAYNTSNLYQRLVRAAADEPASEFGVIFMDSLNHTRPENVHSLMAVLDSALDANCAQAVAIMDEAVQGWTRVINLLQTIFDPEVIVIGGDISASVPRVFEAVRRHLVAEGFEGVVLPAQYETSLIDAVAQGALDTLYGTIYNELMEKFVHGGAHS